MLCRLAGDVDLEVDVGETAEFVGDTVGLPGEFEGIDAVDGGKEEERLADLVLLQVADEVPIDAGGEKGDLDRGFLDFAFAEEEVRRIDGFADDFGGPGLGDGEKLDVFGIPAGAPGGGGDFFFYDLNVFADIAHGLRTYQ